MFWGQKKGPDSVRTHTTGVSGRTENSDRTEAYQSSIGSVQGNTDAKSNHQTMFQTREEAAAESVSTRQEHQFARTPLSVVEEEEDSDNGVSVSHSDPTSPLDGLDNEYPDAQSYYTNTNHSINQTRQATISQYSTTTRPTSASRHSSHTPAASTPINLGKSFDSTQSQGTIMQKAHVPMNVGPDVASVSSDGTIDKFLSDDSNERFGSSNTQFSIQPTHSNGRDLLMFQRKRHDDKESRVGHEKGSHQFQVPHVPKKRKKYAQRRSQDCICECTCEADRCVPGETVNYVIQRYTDSDRELYFVKLVAGSLGKDFTSLILVHGCRTVTLHDRIRTTLRYEFTDALLSGWATAIEDVKLMITPSLKKAHTVWSNGVSIFLHCISDDGFITYFAQYVAYIMMTRTNGLLPKYQTGNMIDLTRQTGNSIIHNLMRVLMDNLGVLRPELKSTFL